MLPAFGDEALHHHPVMRAWAKPSPAGTERREGKCITCPIHEPFLESVASGEIAPLSRDLHPFEESEVDLGDELGLHPVHAARLGAARRVVKCRRGLLQRLQALGRTGGTIDR